MKTVEGIAVDFYEAKDGGTGVRRGPVIEYELYTAGEIDPVRFCPGPTTCGDIKDGFSLSFDGGKSWIVVDIKELTLMYTLAMEKRGGYPLPENAKL